MLDDVKNKHEALSSPQDNTLDTTLSNDDGSAFDILDEKSTIDLINDNVIDDINISNNNAVTKTYNDKINDCYIGDNLADEDDDYIICDQSTPIQKKKGRIPTQKLVLFATFLAFTILFQCIGGYIKIGATSISLVLIPIVLGGVILGVGAGTLLGFAFGFVTLMYGVSGADPFTATLLASSPFLTVLTCIGKATLCGFCSSALYKVIAKKNMLIGCIVASIAAPIVNTGLFILGGLTMSGALEGIIASNPDTVGMEPFYFLVIVCAGINFLVELAVNIVASPAIFALNKIYIKRYAR